MKKVVFAILALALSTACASAQVAFTPINWSGNITLNATVQQSLSISLDGHNVNFNVTSGTAAMPGDKTITLSGTANLKHGGAVSLWADATDLVSVDNGKIPATNILLTTGGPFGGAVDAPYPGDYSWYFAAITNGTQGNADPGIVGKTFSIPMSFKLAPVGNIVPNVYTGTITIYAQVS